MVLNAVPGAKSISSRSLVLGVGCVCAEFSFSVDTILVLFLGTTPDKYSVMCLRYWLEDIPLVSSSSSPIM